MLRTALALLSSLQIGLRIKGAIERALRQAVVIAVAAVVLIAAAAFGLLAAYYALVFFFGITPLQASGIMAAVLILLGLLILATLPLFARKPRWQEPSLMASAGEGVVGQGSARRCSRSVQGRCWPSLSSQESWQAAAEPAGRQLDATMGTICEGSDRQLGISVQLAAKTPLSYRV